MRDLTRPRRHIIWKQIKVWVVTYRAEPSKRHPKGVEVKVYSITRPTKTKTLRVAGGRRKFTAVKVERPIKEFIVMGKSSKNKSDEITDNELEELENLEDVVDADEPDEDEKPAKKGKKGKKGGKGAKTADDSEETPKKKRSTGAAPGKSRAAANGKIGTAEIAAKGGTDARTLRMVLRKHEIPKDEETGRYEFDSWDNKTVKKILKLLKDGEADAVKKEGLQRLKDSKDAKAKTEESDAAETPKKKKDKKGKKNKS